MEKPTFEIGLTMAGAVSAGAYTAGVIDFLFEALDAIEDVRAGRPVAYLDAGLPKQNPIVDVPHDVKLRAMSGTSAGSMATAIVATILGTRVPPVTAKRSATDATPAQNPLYDAWVNDIHYTKLLSTGDIADKTKTVRSVLNAAPLNDIVDETLSYVTHARFVRPYVVDSIPIYFCVSNLRGVRYSLALSVSHGVATEYQMSMHADWMRFEWSNTATPKSLLPGQVTAEWKLMGKSALASGAFPVGLAAQTLTRGFSDYVQRTWFDLATDTQRTYPPLDTPANFPPQGDYDFVNADGGIFDNEPLELCRRELAGDGRNPREPDKATRAVILIDPFPNLFELEHPYDTEKHSELLDVIKSVFAAMIAQGRFKLDELALAHDPNVASRYAIMPIRYDANDKQEKYAIACGSLGGFGGFLSKEFRHHDYMLGRRNCQKFLASHFALPCDRAKGIENPLFALWPDDLRATFRIAPGPDDPPPAPDYLPIVPLLGKLASPDYTVMPPWPANPRDLTADDLKAKVLERAEALKDSLIAQYKPKFALNAGIRVYWWLNKSTWIDRFVIDTVRKDLDQRGITLS